MAPRHLVWHLAMVGFVLAILAVLVIGMWLEVHGRLWVAQ